MQMLRVQIRLSQAKVTERQGTQAKNRAVDPRKNIVIYVHALNTSVPERSRTHLFQSPQELKEEMKQRLVLQRHNWEAETRDTFDPWDNRRHLTNFFFCLEPSLYTRTTAVLKTGENRIKYSQAMHGFLPFTTKHKVVRTQDHRK